MVGLETYSPGTLTYPTILDDRECAADDVAEGVVDDGNNPAIPFEYLVAIAAKFVMTLL
jgi:hypothetical protein